MSGVTPGPGVTTVTLGELLTMTSRLPENPTLYTVSESSTEFVAAYLQNAAVIPTQGYVYSNTNFTILQEVIAAITGRPGVQGYVDWVEAAVLRPLNIDVGVFNDVPDDASTGTMTYNPQDPSGPGHWWPQMQCVGAGGWVGSAPTVATYLAGVSSGVVIPTPLSTFMMQQLFGWYHAGTLDGLAFHHNGDLTHDGNGLSTGVVQFPDGSAAVLLTNAPRPGIITLMVRAYQTRGPGPTATA
jgi:CubicO group peptidase (beta-lactamase class C family)